LSDQSSLRTGDAAHVFALGRTAGAYARELDWATTDLGPVELWSPALRCAASLIMRNESPMWLCWGPTFVQLRNDACEVLLPLRHGQATGQRLSDCEQEDLAVVTSMVERVFSGHSSSMPANSELVLNRTQRGKQTSLRLTFSPVPDDATDSGIGGVLVTVSEVSTTTNQPTHDNHALYPFLMQVPIPVCVLFGPDLVFEIANPAFRTMMDRPNIVGRTLDQVFPELRDQGAAGRSFSELLRAVMTDGHVFEHRELPAAIERDGQSALAYFNAVFAPINLPGGVVERVMVVSTEITSEVLARVKAEEAQRTLETTGAELRAAAALRDDFLTVASHELRTPLTTLGLQIDGLLLALLQATPEATPTQKLLDKANKVRIQADRLEALIEGMLDVFSLRSDTLTLQLAELDLADAARSVVSRLALEFRSIHIDLQAQTSVGKWDRARVEQVMSALVSNALKFGAGKPIEVGVGGSATAARVWVRDRGIGIEPDDQRRIFDRFVRAAPSSQYAGFGLGLWIVQEIVKAMGGHVEVQSEPGVGSTFVVELPRSP
jgi:signal transduction histidine kinase